MSAGQHQGQVQTDHHPWPHPQDLFHTDQGQALAEAQPSSAAISTGVYRTLDDAGPPEKDLCAGPKVQR